MRWAVLMCALAAFGGRSQVLFADTWEWDGSAWTRVTTGADPPARSGIVMTYDDVNRRAVWFGGRSLVGTIADDTWQLGYMGSWAATIPTAGAVATRSARPGRRAQRPLRFAATQTAIPSRIH